MKINSRLNTCTLVSATTSLLPVGGLGYGLGYKLVSELDYECVITFSMCDYGNMLTCVLRPSACHNTAG